MLGRDRQDTQDIQCEESVRVQDRHVKGAEDSTVGDGSCWTRVANGGLYRRRGSCNLPGGSCGGTAQNQAMKITLAGATSLKEGWM